MKLTPEQQRRVKQLTDPRELSRMSKDDAEWFVATLGQKLWWGFKTAVGAILLFTAIAALIFFTFAL